MRERFTIKGHAINRYFERVLGRPDKNCHNTDRGEVEYIKAIMRQEISQSRQATPEERAVVGKQRPDTDVYFFEDHAYFFRTGKHVLVTMMVVDAALQATMHHLVESSGYALEPPKAFSGGRSVRKLPNDTRYVHHDATIEIPPELTSFLQTGMGWYRDQQLIELYRLLAWKWSHIPHVTLRGVLPDEQFEMWQQYYFHAAADLLIGVQRTNRRSAETGRIVNIDTISSILPLSKDTSFSLSLRNHRALWGSFSTTLRCESDVLARIYNVHRERLVDALRFILEQFHDPLTQFANAEDEPDVHVDLDEDVDCYHAPDCFLYFKGNQVVDVVLKEERDMFERMFRPPELPTESKDKPEPTEATDSDVENTIIYLSDHHNESEEASPTYLAMQSLFRISPKTRRKIFRKFGVRSLQEIRIVIRKSLGRMDTAVLSDMLEINHLQLVSALKKQGFDDPPTAYGAYYATKDFVIQVHGSRIEDIFFVPLSFFAQQVKKVVNDPRPQPTPTKEIPDLPSCAVVVKRDVLTPEEIAESMRTEELRIHSSVLNKYYDHFPHTRNRETVMAHMEQIIGEELSLAILARTPTISPDALTSVLPKQSAQEVQEHATYYVFSKYIISVVGNLMPVVNNIFFISSKRTAHFVQR